MAAVITGECEARRAVIGGVYRAGGSPAEAAAEAQRLGLVGSFYTAGCAVWEAWRLYGAQRSGRHWTDGVIEPGMSWGDPYEGVFAVALAHAFGDLRQGKPCVRLAPSVLQRMGYGRVLYMDCYHGAHYCAPDAYRWLTGEWVGRIAEMMGREPDYLHYQVGLARLEAEKVFAWAMWQPD